MNRINIDSNDIFIKENDIYYLEFTSKKQLKVTINANVNCKLIIISNNDYNIDYVLKENSRLIVNSINHDINSNINITLNEYSNLLYNYSIVSQNNCLVNFNINHLTSHSNSEINNNGINLSDNKLHFLINGLINKNLSDINCSQNTKIINYKNGNSKIIPNLIIDSNDIIANHSAYIGNFNYDVKFYMACRGISEKSMNNLLYKAILLGKMDLDSEEEEFKKIINEWW